MPSFNLIAYERMDLANPVSEAALLEVLDQTDLKPGDRVAELGCGNGALAILMARRGFIVEAVDRDEAMAGLARRRVAEANLSCQVTVHAGEAAELAGMRGRFRLISALGTTALGDFERLREGLEPGGWLLWGDLFWRRKPPLQLEAILGPARYETEGGWRARGEAAGLEITAGRVSDDAEWERYADALARAAGEWLAEHPDHPDRPGVATRAAAMEALYGPASRASLGFALHLFRRPAN